MLLILLKFNFFSKLQRLHKELVASGKLTESEFWATKKVKTFQISIEFQTLVRPSYVVDDRFLVDIIMI